MHTNASFIPEEIEAEQDAHAGVQAVEAAELVFGRYSQWSLFVGYVSFSAVLRCGCQGGSAATERAYLSCRRARIGLASYVYSLDNQTTSNYLAFATSYFGAHSLISSIQVAQSIIGELSLPFRLR